MAVTNGQQSGPTVVFLIHDSFNRDKKSYSPTGTIPKSSLLDSNEIVGFTTLPLQHNKSSVRVSHVLISFCWPSLVCSLLNFIQ